MPQPAHASESAGADPFRSQSLWSAFLSRRSRRFAAGMQMPAGPLAYRSRFAPVPLTEDEEAALAFAACGITGPALGDLSYGANQGGNIMVGLVGRTIASGDGIQSVSLAVTNDQATHLIRRPRELPATELPELIEQAHEARLTELFRRQRVKLKDGRSKPSLDPLMNIAVNRWSAHAAGTTTFVPINDLTLLYINGLLEIFSEHTGAFILDERAGFRPAGIGRFARSKGGHLNDDPTGGCVATVKHVELMVAEFAAIEQGMMLQNLALACEALGLGGFPYFANHETAWFEALGFRMNKMPASRYLGMGWLPSFALGLLGKDTSVAYPIGLEHDGKPLLKPFCPPAFPSMRAAVEAVVELKFGRNGIFSGDGPITSWRASKLVSRATPKLSPNAIASTIAYCEHLWNRYGRFPAHIPSYRTVMAFQAGHLDAEFYDHHYQPEALTENNRADFRNWSANAKPRD